MSTSEHPLAVEVRDVVKSFGGVPALDHVSLDLRRGEVHAPSRGIHRALARARGVGAVGASFFSSFLLRRVTAGNVLPELFGLVPVGVGQPARDVTDRDQPLEAAFA